jgi:type II secretory pathway component GspD/PulD (secretin)
LVLAAALGLAGGGAIAQQALEIIALRHRTVEQVLPALQPLVEPGGTLSGSRGQLFLRASAGNVADIKRALEAIDRPLRRLQISVRFDDATERERRGVGASGTIGSGGSRIDITAQDSRRTAGERADQRLQVLEGGRAMIFTGQSRPQRDFIQDLASGFEVTPRMSGDQVFLDIAQQRETPGAQPGSVQGQRLVTTVTTRLGEWVEIGGTASSATRDERGIASASRMRAAESRRVWVKVEELPN